MKVITFLIPLHTNRTFILLCNAILLSLSFIMSYSFHPHLCRGCCTLLVYISSRPILLLITQPSSHMSLTTTQQEFFPFNRKQPLLSTGHHDSSKTLPYQVTCNCSLTSSSQLDPSFTSSARFYHHPLLNMMSDYYYTLSVHPLSLPPSTIFSVPTTPAVNSTLHC